MISRRRRHKSLKKVTVGELSNIFQELKEDELIYRCDFRLIAKHFLSNFLPINTFSSDFKTIVNSFLDNIRFNTTYLSKDENLLSEWELKQKNKIIEVKREETTFYRYICETYLDLVKEPKEELLSLFLNASQNLREVDKILKEIEKQFERIYKHNRTIEIQERKPLLDYYKELNEKAKKEILEFIKNDIKEFALKNCFKKSLFENWILKIPYDFYIRPESFIPKEPNDLENKFSELLLSEVKDLLKMYNDNKKDFNSFLSKYIEREEIIFNIKERIYEHHILESRKDIILETLESYEAGSKMVFTNAIPNIIEGILHDLCILIGGDENELLKEGMQIKLNRLKDALNTDLSYEYYSFRFRILRNKVAHGRMIKTDVDEFADLLLLDLYDICKVVFSHGIKLNHKLFIIDQINKNLTKVNYDYLLEYLLLEKIEVPTFYNLNSKIQEVDKLLVSNEFWKYLEKQIDSGGEAVKHGVYMILKIISARKPFDKRCTRLFKKLNLKQGDLNLANDYLHRLTRDF